MIFFVRQISQICSLLNCWIQKKMGIAAPNKNQKRPLLKSERAFLIFIFLNVNSGQVIFI